MQATKATKVLGFQKRNLVLQDEEMTLKFLHSSCHVILAVEFHDERIRINIRKLGHQCQGFSTLTSWISWSRNLSVNWSTLLLFIYVYLSLYPALFRWVRKGLPTAKTALNQPPMPSLRRGQHLKDACISTPWSIEDIEVAGNPRGPQKKSFSWAWVRMLIYYGYTMDILWIHYGYIMDILWIYYGFGGYIEIGHNEPRWTFGEGSSSSVDLPRNRCTTGLIPLTHWISPCPCRRRYVDP